MSNIELGISQNNKPNLKQEAQGVKGESKKAREELKISLLDQEDIKLDAKLQDLTRFVYITTYGIIEEHNIKGRVDREIKRLKREGKITQNDFNFMENKEFPLAQKTILQMLLAIDIREEKLSKRIKWKNMSEQEVSQVRQFHPMYAVEYLLNMEIRDDTLAGLLITGRITHEEYNEFNNLSMEEFIKKRGDLLPVRADFWNYLKLIGSK